MTSQYQNASNLNVRILLHQRFSTNKYGWSRWVFDQFSLPPQCCILELGCGTGDLWLENLDCIPVGWGVVFLDYKALQRLTRRIIAPYIKRKVKEVAR